MYSIIELDPWIDWDKPDIWETQLLHEITARIVEEAVDNYAIQHLSSVEDNKNDAHEAETNKGEAADTLCCVVEVTACVAVFFFEIRILL